MSKVANKSDEITDEQWLSVNEENRQIAEEYLRESIQLSPYTLKQYESALKIYFVWVHDNAKNKPFYELRSRDYLLYQNSLVRRGLSSSAIKLKRSVISSFNTYIETYYLDEYPTFRNYVTKKIPAPTPSKLFEKQPLTPEEYENLCEELEKRELYEQLAYLKFSYSSGCRRNEVRQLLKEVVNYEPTVREIEIKNEDGKLEKRVVKSYLSHIIRCKGRGEAGKPRKLQFDQDAMNAIKKWLEVRGDDDCPYVFVSHSNGEIKQVSESTFNAWASTIFTEIVGRRVHPHLLRSSRATNLIIYEGRSMTSAQKLLGHQDISTTQIYIVRDDEDASDEAFLE